MALCIAAAPIADALSAAPPPVDPVERLRERLAQRLAAVKTSASGGDLDLRVPARPPSPATGVSHPSGSPSTRARAASRAGRSAAAAAPQAPDWNHGDGAGGPGHWADLRPEWAQCGSGRRQSPIDVTDGLTVGLEPIRFDYGPGAFAVQDTGHTVQVNVAPGSAIEVQGRRYELLQFDFRHPGEGRLGGRAFEMTVHLLHRAADGRLAVVAIALERGPAHAALQQIWMHLPLERHGVQAAQVPFDPSRLLPAERRHHAHMGSLTTPPCTEGVLWLTLDRPVAVSAAQIEVFARLYPMNARPLQATADRRILRTD